ncbi:hypothetical protein CVT24_001151 [Panaeolus cyanescens]|uniref:Heat shock 70 kDa protein 12A n=1 Tax=Panaeolus cyanescens TaxID=181874 RepID=A0A409W6T8_9AGAR|nr:hypothetical protein CVT24_001151 [Panaeolus cyanescens]
MLTRSPYSGSQRKLVLAFDVGTTFSGVSYSILDPGEIPEIRGVTRFPAQENVGGDSKIPTILYYDAKGAVRAVGAEANREGVEEDAEDQGWIRAEWFKLHMRPKTKATAHITDKIPPLPDGKNAMDLFADFLRYLHNCARSYIEETHANGPELWKSLEANIDYVLTHPNGWEGGQQNQMRRAAITAGLITDDEKGRARLSFVTEGEASLHFCVQSGLTTEAIKGGKGILIVDAGGGTIDISAYKQADGAGYEEIAAPQCHLQGSITVTARAETFLNNHLKNSKFSGDVKHISRCFDKTTKLRFRNVEESQYIKFGTLKDRDLTLNIRSGQLRLTGTEVAAFFEPSVNCIIKSIEEQRRLSSSQIASIFLVGGFAASDWLFKQLRDRFSGDGINVSRPDSHVNKAVADGAISFYLDHFVSARIAKFDYGTPMSMIYRPDDPEHQSRGQDVYTGPSGRTWIKGLFDPILPKNTKVTETQQFRSHYLNESYSKHALGTVVVPITCYRGKIDKPKWIDTDPTMYHTLCYVEADTSVMCESLVPRMSLTKKKTALPYYEIQFDIVLSLGMTEFKAHIAWMEDGIEKTSPAEFVYDTNALVPHAMED